MKLQFDKSGRRFFFLTREGATGDPFADREENRQGWQALHGR